MTDEDTPGDPPWMTKRTGHARGVANAAADYLKAIGIDPASFNLTDEELAAGPRHAPLAPAPVARDTLEALGWPRRALDGVGSADTNRHAISALRARGDSEGIVVLSGPPGCGKTVAAAWQALERTRSTAFVRASEFARTSRYKADLREQWFAARCLCLDDLGAEYVDEKGSLLVDLDELIDVFYADRRRLTITTNCTAKAFGERYGARITDRLAECAVWIRVRDASMRIR